MNNKFHIIPAIDIIGGKCVRLTKGDYNNMTLYNEHPLEVALMFEDAGITKLHLVDLDGAKAKKIINYKVLETLATKTHLQIDFGGGIQSDEDINIAFECGAQQITGGSVAVKNKDLFSSWLSKYSAEKIILGADVISHKIAIHGWQNTSDIDLDDFISEYLKIGIKYTISTDVSKDGMLTGPSFEMYSDMKQKFPSLCIIASGGVSNIEDVIKLSELNIYGVVIGKALYEGKIKIGDISSINKYL
ncbi:MAG: 1-(5-phosphoribosyl)-5-[(5-phosphoribosylamino)methylideneamino]imidazole-4-carboxamide isomerase [Cytophagales bacterium]|nr:1-(5-phosphoribosyl)-5-[(5-phosphoribosylamino)methylideneamino]imidazole-4-carboxamide isomerase [Cytophagales bacterium]